MAEGANGAGSAFDTEGGEPNYYDEMEGVTGNAEILKFAQKYNSAEEAIIGGYNAESKIGASFRIPETLDNLTEEQKAELHGVAKKLRDVPETADGYEITVPEGLERNETLETAFKEWAFGRGMDKKDVAEVVGFYHQALIAAKEQEEQRDMQAFDEADSAFKLQSGVQYGNKMEGIRRLRMHAAEEMGVTYPATNEKGEEVIGSKLDDALDRKDAQGKKLGNHPIIMQFLSWIYDSYMAEGEPVEVAGPAQGKGRGFFDYDERDVHKD